MLIPYTIAVSLAAAVAAASVWADRPSRRRINCPPHVASQPAKCLAHATFSDHVTGARATVAAYAIAVRGTCIHDGIRRPGAYQLRRW
jgi:hypothetical protein